MLVVISDLHLTDGSSGETISPGAFEIFAQRIADLAMRASWRSDSSYRPIQQIDLILLGDVLDVIRSSSWQQSEHVRPWKNPTSSLVAETVSQITHRILERNEPSFDLLRRMAHQGSIQIPPGDQRGRMADTPERLSIPVKIHYMVGNHDWFFHLPGFEYDALRRTIVQRMGLANDPDQPFPHEPSESDDLMRVMRRHKVFARHGDIFDPINFENVRDESSLGDVIVIELVNKFAARVERELAGDLPAAVVRGLREIDNVRPLLMIPVWVDGLLERACPSPAVRVRVKEVWDQMADDFLQLDFLRDRDTWSPFDLVDGMERALKFSKRLSIGWASSIATWLQSMRGSKNSSYYHHALAEQDFRNRRAKHIIYGHTHEAETIPLDASYCDGYVHNQVYFNSGTWRRSHRQTRLDMSEHEFIASDMMTLLSFFQGDERGGRPYESWSGTLGLDPPEAAVHRLDASHDALSPHVSGQPMSPPIIHHNTPHFTISTDVQGVVSSD